MWLIRTSQSMRIGIDLSIDKTIKVGRSDLFDIDCIGQSVKIGYTPVSFIDWFMLIFYRFEYICSIMTVIVTYFKEQWRASGISRWNYEKSIISIDTAI